MNTVRYFKLNNGGAFVAQIVIEYRERQMDGKGDISYDTQWKSWFTEGYRDILQYAERTVDLLSDSPIPDGSQVRLHVYVAAGSSDPATQQFIYDKNSPSMANYNISGTTLNNTLTLLYYR